MDLTEVTLVETTLGACFAPEKPERLIGDRAYDSDPLDEQLAEQGIDMTAPHRRNRRKPRTQDGRKLRRYLRRWKVERLIAWLATSDGCQCAMSVIYAADNDNGSTYCL
jgi:hypothetical protein